MLEMDPRWPGRRVQHHVPDWSRGDSLQVSQSQHLDPLRGPYQPARSRGLRRAVVSGRGHADRPHRLRDLLRLAVSGGDPSAGGKRRGGARARVGLHGPVGRDRADELVDIVNRCRALENTAYVAAANQGASLRHYPPYSWPGGSQVVDFEGRLLAEASPGPGERIVVAPIDIGALRHERATRRGHHMLAHLRTEAYPIYARHQYPPSMGDGAADGLSYERNNELIDASKQVLQATPPAANSTRSP